MKVSRLTRAQRRALELGLEHSAAVPHVTAHRIRGLDAPRLRAAVDALADRFAVFRRSYLPDGDGWIMVDGIGRADPLEEFDLRGSDPAQVWRVAAGLGRANPRPEAPPLVRFHLVRGPDEDILVLTAASFALDRFSIAPLLRALSQAYSCAGSAAGPIGAGIDVPELDQDAALAAEDAYLGSPDHIGDLEFWSRLLAGSQFEWKPARSDDAADRIVEVPLSPGAVGSVGVVCAETGLEPGAVVMLATHVLLSRLTGQRRVLTGMHHRAALAGDAIGFAQQRGVLLSEPDPGMTVRAFLLAESKLLEYGESHSRVPAAEVMEQLRRRDASVTVLSTTTLEEDWFPHGALDLGGAEVTDLPDLAASPDASDIVMRLRGGDAPRFVVTVRDPARSAAVQQAMPHLMTLLEGMAGGLDEPLADLSAVSAAQAGAILAASSGRALPDSVPSALQLIGERAAGHPDSPAVVYGETSLSYAELVAAVERVAARIEPLIADLADPLVGLCMERSAEMVIGLLAILRAGAGYLPLDPKNPADRLAYIVDDAAAAAVLVHPPSARAGMATGIARVLDVAEILREPAAGPPVSAWPGRDEPDETAYVIYTSGTTGKPKGVVVERRNLAHHIASWEGVAGTGPGDRWLQFASINFDASVMEVFNCLTRGAALVVAPADVRSDPVAVWDLLDAEAITHAFLPPALLRVLPRRPPSALRVVYCGGEAGDTAALEFWSQAVRYWNVYGPTETTVTSSANLLGPGKSATDLGTALPGYTMLLLDDDGALVPDGGVGEIWIGGDAVTRGYLNRPELTRERFVANPFGPGRLYRTGDLARRYPGGGLEYLGRNDFQVKVRGFRIELGDIEAAIRSVPGVTGVLVTTVEQPGGTALAAWYTSAETSPEHVADVIGRTLPSYMVPSHLVRLDAFPLSISGKIDRTRLLLPEAAAGSSRTLGPGERTVRAIWADVLQIDAATIGADGDFYHLGGHSLAAALVAHRLSEATGNEVRPRDILQHPVLADLAAHVANASAAAPVRPVARTGATRAPVVGSLIPMMWSRAVGVGQDTTYTIVVRVDFDATCDPGALRAALRELLESDPVFRSAFADVDGSLHLVVQPDAPVAATFARCDDAELDRRVAAARETAFDMATAPLWQAQCLTRDDGGSTVLLAVHHGIFDGWSLNLFIADLGRRYDAVRRRRQVQGYLMHPLLPEGSGERSRVTALDAGVWAADPELGPARAAARDYWRAKLAGAQCRTELPYTATTAHPDANRWLDLVLPRAAVTGMEELAARCEVTRAPVLFAAYLVWLWRVSGQSDLVVSYPYAGRDAPGSQDIYGMFVTMGFLRVGIDPQEPFESLVRRVADQMISDREHLIASPYDTDLSRCGVPNLVFSLQSGIGLDGTTGGLSFRAEEYPSRTSKADLTGVFYETGAGVAGRVEYDSSLLDDGLVASLAAGLPTVVTAAVGRPDLPVMDLDYLDPAQSARIRDFAVGPPAPEVPATVTGAFGEVVAAHPRARALVWPSGSMTYGELDAAAESLAARMVEQFAPQRGTLIGLSVARGPAAIIGMLAALRAGCGYVPLDPSYPADRLRYIIEDSGARIVLSDERGRAAVGASGATGLTLIDPAGDRGAASGGAKARTGLPRVRPDDLAYTIYTSGSTGRPKGVMIEHRSVPRMILGAARTIGFGPDSLIPLLGTLNFDASVLQVFLPLLTGGTLLLPPPDLERDPDAVHDYLVGERATHVLMTPALLRNLPHRPLPDLVMLGFGGEAIDAATAEHWAANAPLTSMYGPTETTVMCSLGRIEPGSDPRILGRPLPGYTMHLLNESLQPVPAGAVGEIYIGGGGEARGYLGRPDLTMQRFIHDPVGESAYAWAYRSGDLGRYRDDGTIEYFGRNDDQIKLRGFRIELGEVEAALAQVPGVTGAAAAVRGAGDLRAIVGYYTAGNAPTVVGEGGGELGDEDLRTALSRTLPEYMIPTFYVRLDELPLNANGKLDRNALPEVVRSGGGDPPRPGLESGVAAIWERLLVVTGVGRTDNFFHLGGNSLLAAHLQTSLREELGLDRSLAAIYAAPTIAGLVGDSGADAAAAANRDAAEGLMGVVDAADGPPPPTIRTVLLTGATGFLGGHLLADLTSRVERVVCLVRAADAREGLARLRADAERAGLEPDWRRVTVLPGDLGSPRLAVSDDTWAGLDADVDAVVHCGAWVHHRYSYATLKPTNVAATAELLRFALRAKRKWFTFVSTESVGDAVAGLSAWPEEVPDPNEHPAVGGIGYLLGKWVSEQYVADAARRYGLDAVIARPGNITGDSRTGFSNFENNHFWLLAKGCVQLGAYPDVPGRVEMVPVDRLSSQITALALARLPGLTVANMGSADTITEAEFMDRLAVDGGYALAREDPEVWQRRLADLDPDNALFPLRELYAGDLTEAPREVLRGRAAALLAGSGLEGPQRPAELIDLYVATLLDNGFLPPP